MVITTTSLLLPNKIELRGTVLIMKLLCIEFLPLGSYAVCACA